MAVKEIDKQYTEIAIPDIGTQLFWWNKTTKVFEYGVPVTAGAEFGGDVESFEVGETDLGYKARVAGLPSLNDIPYQVNYTADKYRRVREISDNTEMNTYMEVFSDGSAMVFQGTSAGMPKISAGDTKVIDWTIVPSAEAWVSNIYDLQTFDIAELGKIKETVHEGTSIKIDASTIPTARQDYAVTKGAPASQSAE